MSQKVLLTGANGYLGSWILSLLLSRGYKVRAIVRSQSKASQVLDDFATHSEQLDFGIVPDITIPGAFDSIFQAQPPFTTIIHTASPFHHRVTNVADFLDPAIKGTTELLKSVKKFAPEVKRVIITSSCASVIDFSRPVASIPPKVYNEDDWNPITYEEALANTKNPFFAYRASKRYAEQAARDFVLASSPNFDVVTLCPPGIFGPLRHTIKRIADLNETTGRIYSSFLDTKKDSPLPVEGVYMYVDVRDIALAHILAMEVPEAGGERFIVTAGKAPSQTISDILRSNFPELEERTPIGTPGKDSLPENAYTISAEKAKKVLGWEGRSIEETFIDMVKQLLEVERNEAR